MSTWTHIGEAAAKVLAAIADRSKQMAGKK